MLDWLFIIPLLPLVSSLILLLLAGRLKPFQVASLGVSSLGISALLTLLVGLEFVSSGAEFYHQQLFSWLPLADSPVYFGLYLDQLSLTMTGVITGVGWLIHWYAAAYMFTDKQVQRFFVYMNLFVFAMLMLVLGDNLVLLYLGWEGVGLCSFLLIGFWQYDAKNVAAARKAFVVTRVGDAAMMIGLLILFEQFNSLAISEVVNSNQEVDSATLSLACLLLIGGAVGKSAQLPLHTWLPDAMAGPTPVSALIHAATMVTAGVYLIARMHPLFLQVPHMLTLVAWIGAITLVLAGLAALAQTDIKRILAYSTMSQIGYMFVALGAKSFDNAIFHLMTHAFFKALLFLTAGSIILKLHHQQNIFKMGGVFKTMPITSVFLLVGLLALVAFPGTSGFFSKEAILAAVYASDTTGIEIWLLALLGSFLTSLYSFRLLFIVCFGQANTQPEGGEFKWSSQFVVPLLPLVLLAVIGGFMPLSFEGVFTPTGHPHISRWLAWLPVMVAALGFALSWYLYFPRQVSKPEHSWFNHFLLHGLGFDALYRRVFIVPFKALARLNKSDVFDLIYRFLAWFNFSVNEVVVVSQNGRLRWYLFATAAGAVLMLGGLILWA